MIKLQIYVAQFQNGNICGIIIIIMRIMEHHVILSLHNKDIKNIFKIWITILAWYGVDLIVLL